MNVSQSPPESSENFPDPIFSEAPGKTESDPRAKGRAEAPRLRRQSLLTNPYYRISNSGRERFQESVLAALLPKSKPEQSSCSKETSPVHKKSQMPNGF